mgnify:CR=1 FL=1
MRRVIINVESEKIVSVYSFKGKRLSLDFFRKNYLWIAYLLLLIGFFVK